jgi:hypothetical protein
MTGCAPDDTEQPGVEVHDPFSRWRIEARAGAPSETAALLPCTTLGCLDSGLVSSALTLGS